ncbi:hypothetical protein KC887_02080 [Candidatus Kaiserbacteria bacterium]|nr:hypothetical protein [Candidatus Kaiserbacteria bacterium]
MGRIKKRKYSPIKYAKSWAKGLRIETWDSEDLPCGTKIARATDKFGRYTDHRAVDNAKRFLLDWKVTMIAKALDVNGDPVTIEHELFAKQVKLDDLEEVYVAERDEIKSQLTADHCQLIDFGYIAVAA